MIYGMLLWPHANSRYQDAVKPLALGEMALLLQSAGLKAQPEWTRAAQTDILRFEAPALTIGQMEMLRRHSAIYLLCQWKGTCCARCAARRTPSWDKIYRAF